ncbi:MULTISPECIES: hypothetical protein [Bacteria]|uniref:hypothetical protein n=1 Tax=Bacteria TaxID=2 RepID=UPI003C7B6D82
MTSTDITIPSIPGEYISTVDENVVVRITDPGAAFAVVSVGDTTHESPILDLPFFASLYGPFNAPSGSQPDPEPASPSAAPSTRRSKRSVA